MSAMALRHQHKGKTLGAFLLAALSCILGLSFCLIKSPQAKSEAYLAAALTAYQNARPQEAASAALEAVRLDPAAPKTWRILSTMLQQNGQETAARQAGIIASKLQHNPSSAEPLYAMPAELKLSFLAAAHTDIP